MVMRMQPPRRGTTPALARNVLGALMFLLAGTFSVGTVLAQTKPPSPAPADAASSQSPDWLRGRWTFDPSSCQTEIGPDYIASGLSNLRPHGNARVEAAFSTAGDEVVITVGRTLEGGPDNVPPPGSTVVIRRVADGLEVVSLQVPGQPSAPPPPGIQRHCS
jgi:hypothetical protein